MLADYIGQIFAGHICQIFAGHICQIFAGHICLWAVFIFLGCRFRSRWQTLSEEEMADCARGRSVRYLRVQLNAILGYTRTLE